MANRQNWESTTDHVILSDHLLREITDCHRLGFSSKVTGLPYLAGCRTDSIDNRHMPRENWSGVLKNDAAASPVVRSGESFELKAT